MCSLLTATVLSPNYTSTAEANTVYENGYDANYGKYNFNDTDFKSKDIYNTSALTVNGYQTDVTINNSNIIAGEAGPNNGGKLTVNGGKIRSITLNSEGGDLNFDF